MNAPTVNEAIVNVWTAGGIHAVTHRNVAAEAGVSKGKLQHAYPTAADLVAAGAALLIDGSGLLWSELELDVHARLGLPPGARPPAGGLSARDLAAVEAYVWVARNVR